MEYLQGVLFGVGVFSLIVFLSVVFAGSDENHFDDWRNL